MGYKLCFATLTPLGAKVAEKLHGTRGNSTGYEIADIEMLLEARRKRNGPDFKVVS